MQFTHVLSILFWITVTPALASVMLDREHNGLQQIPIGGEEVETLTFHFTTTRTRFEFEFYTKTMTREQMAATAQPTPTGSSQEQEAQTQFSGRRTDKCDETACAICTWYYECERGTPEW
ncbi:hypothetical protein M409DRAFT_25799 [Zasmidium cellare ATCC 36951]|uniref:Uncharacterized protein n=1 Tax=Zasmidium cellare ATCC 36951 TaxID=1080233 RepID=A0A6A6CCX6_ZASCE|nr:uncharacterized protein M409DRAFT_25799 [Zasmidium cellare ATCC 36951]KAF2164028.1 hypothetical protein M409DRAFT_25799 [Zasmidium cellare ATCC 36951]